MTSTGSASASVEEYSAAVVAHDCKLASTDPRLVLANDPDSPAAASFRVLRQRLASRKGLRTVVVTSAEPREGKTTCAVNLSMALGEGGRARVLLVEANLRSPGVAELLGITPPLCFAAQLASIRSHLGLVWVVASVQDPAFHVLAVSPASPRLHLDAVAFDLAIKALGRAGYDFIVIDAPAVLDSADVNLIQDSADGILLTTWSKRSRGPAQLRALEQLGPGNIVGFVLLNAWR